MHFLLYVHTYCSTIKFSNFNSCPVRGNRYAVKKRQELFADLPKSFTNVDTDLRDRRVVVGGLAGGWFDKNPQKMALLTPTW